MLPSSKTTRFRPSSHVKANSYPKSYAKEYVMDTLFINPKQRNLDRRRPHLNLSASQFFLQIPLKCNFFHNVMRSNYTTEKVNYNGMLRRKVGKKNCSYEALCNWRHASGAAKRQSCSKGTSTRPLCSVWVINHSSLLGSTVYRMIRCVCTWVRM